MMAQQHDKNISLHMHVANILPQNSTRCSIGIHGISVNLLFVQKLCGSWYIGKLIADYRININLRSRISDPPPKGIIIQGSLYDQTKE